MDDKIWLKNYFLEYKNLVYRVAVSIIKDAQLAEDIVQEVFVTLYCKADHIQDINKIKPWLVKTTVNRAIDFTRKSKRVVILGDDFFEQLQDKTSADPASDMDKRELSLEIHKTMDMLPPEMKALVFLYYFLEIPQKEIAEDLGLAIGTVKTRLRRARMA